MHTIDLTQPRIVVIDTGKRKYKLTVAAPIAKKLWLKYFESVVNASEYTAAGRVDSNDSSAARRELAEAVLIDAEGYTAGTPLKEIENWQTKLPASHLLTLGGVLVSVTRSLAEPDEAIVLGQETVLLDAIWGADENGEMRKTTGLGHKFETPNADQQRRFSRAASRSCVVGGSRARATHWLGAQGTLVDLYDELILTVDGYSANGSPLTGPREAIVPVMDAYHKATAADALFTPAPLSVAEEGEK